MADSHIDSKMEEGLPGDWTGRGPLQSGRRPSELPAHGSKHIPRRAAQVVGEPGYGDRRP